MFSATRLTIAKVLVVMFSVILPGAGTAFGQANTQIRSRPQPTGLRNSFAPPRQNVNSMGSKTASSASLRLTGIPVMRATGAPGAGGSNDGGSQGGGSQGGDSQSGGSQSQAAPSDGQAPQPYVSPYDLPEATKRDTALATMRRHGGGLDWPIGLRTLPPTDSMKELREELDGIVESILRTPADQPLPVDVFQAAARGIERVAAQFQRKSIDMPLSSAQERDARKFLKNAYAAVKALEPTPVEATVQTKSKP
jgi:hypothetical protein